MSTSTTNPIFIEAYKHIRNGQLKAARQKLREAIKTNPYSERAWLLMSMAVTDTAQQQECLQRVLSLNPQHAEAQQRLAKLQPTPEAQPPITKAEAEIGEPNSLTATVTQAEALGAPSAEETHLTDVESKMIAETSALEAEPEVEVMATPKQSGGANAEAVLEESTLTAEAAVEATPSPEPETWTAEPTGLPEWLMAQSMVDATLPDIEPSHEADFEDEDEGEEEELEAKAISPKQGLEAPEPTPSSEEAAPPASAEASKPETAPTPAPRAKRRRARRLHTDYLQSHPAPTPEEELPAWLADEAETATRSAPDHPLHPPTTVAPSAPVTPPVASLEPAPIRVQPTRPAVIEKEPAQPYYSGSYLQGDAPSWALPLMIFLLSLAVIGLLAFLIYLIL